MNSKLWLNELKISIINKDSQKTIALIENLPKFDSISDLISAREIVGEFIAHLKREKSDLQKAMFQIKQAKKFLED